MSKKQNDLQSYSFGPNEAVLRSNLGHVHPGLGNLVQYFTRNEQDYEHLLDGREYWDSSFQLLVPNGTATMNARDYPRPIKDIIWSEVFRLKGIFFEEEMPDVVIHRIKHGLDFEKRLIRYREQLNLPNYDIFSGGRIISIEHK